MQYRTLQLFLIIAVFLVVGFVAVPSTSAALPCQDQDTLGDGISCPVGEICNAGTDCNPFDLVASGTAVGATSIYTQVQSNADAPHTITLYSCLGGQAVCGNPTANPTNWRNEGTQAVFDVTFSGLRPGRTYSMSFYSTFEGMVGQLTIQGTTWPLPQFTPTVSNIGDTTATVSWTTPFSGDSVVHYSLTSLQWARENAATGTTGIYSGTAISNGEAWFVGSNGLALHRPADIQPLRDWESGTGLGLAYLVSVDTVDGSNIWASGYYGETYQSVDHGASWTRIATGTTDDLYTIYTATPSTAWAAGRDQRVLFYSGGSWQSKRFAVIGKALNAIFTLDDKTVWTGGSGREIIVTTDQGLNWNTTILPGSAPQTVLSISSLDGITVWAGGTGGSLWKYSGSSWANVPFPTGETIRNITMLGTNDFYFTADARIGHYLNGVITFSSQFRNDFGTDPTALAFANGAKGIAAGSGVVASFGVNGSIKSGTGTGTHQVLLDGLAPGAQYYFAAISTGSGVAQGGFGTFTTTNPDTINPTISFTAPTGTPFLTNQATLTVTGTASDNLAVQTITLNSVNGSTNTAYAVNKVPALPNSGPVAWTSAMPVTFIPGTNTLTATACDGSSNCVTATQVIFYDNQAPTLTITSPTAGSTVNTATITVAGTSSDDDQVVSGEYSLNNGPVQTFTIVNGQNPLWSFSLTGMATGSNTLQVYVKDRVGNTSAPASVTFNYFTPTFDVTVAPATQTISAGQPAAYTVTLTPQNGFTGQVTLTLTGNPAGSTMTYTQNPVALGASAVTTTLTIQTASTPTGTFPLTITGTGGGVTKTTTADLVIIAPPDFNLSNSSGVRTILAGSSTTYSISATANPTYAGTVSNLTLATSPSAPLPAGVTATFAPTTLTLASSQTLTTTLSVATTAATPNGTYTLRVSGTDTVQSITRFVDITLVVNLPPDVTLTVLPATQTITAGGGTAANYNGKAIALNGYSRPSIVTASVGSVITGLTITVTPSNFVPATGPAGTDFVLNMIADSRVPAGTYTVTVTLRADDNSLTKTVQVQLVITGDTTPPIISITQPDVNPNYDRVTVAWRTNEAADSRLEVYQDAARTVLVGVLSDPAYATTRSLLYVGLNPLTTYYLRVISADQAPTVNTASAITFDDGSPLLFTTLDTPDFTPPTITITQPTSGQTILGTVSITGTASDNNIVSTILVTIIRPDGTQAYAQTINPGTASYNFVVTWNSLADRVNGDHTIKARATDAAGNLSPEATVVINVQNDLTPPVVLTNYPEAVNLFCDPVPNTCQITIHWFTDDASTSKVEYAREDTYFNSGYALTADYDDADANTSPSVPVYREHIVTLKNLNVNFLYHYRITSCNISGDCTN